MSDNRLSEITGVTPDARTFEKGQDLPFSDLFGVEIELENLPINDHDAPDVVRKYWRIETDGSLRNNGREFVLHRPLAGADMESALAAAHLYLRQLNPVASKRCSVHIHMDVSGLTVRQLVSLIIYYTMYEKVLFRYAGMGRADNIYCIPLYKGQESFPAINRALTIINKEGKWSNQRRSDVHRIFSKYNKYSAMNLAPMVSLGSAEFRHHPGEYRYERLVEWINILHKLKERAVNDTLDWGEFYSPLQDMSSKGPEVALREFFGDALADALITEHTGADLFEGARTAQEFIFANRVAMGSGALLRWLMDAYPEKMPESKSTARPVPKKKVSALPHPPELWVNPAIFGNNQ